MQLRVRTTDYHTAGEPFRIVHRDVPLLEGQTMLDKRRHAHEHLDVVRRLLVHEPRGHADMYGGFVTRPDDEGADLGVVFFHNDGYSTACGHGTIALVTWALESGLIARSGSEQTVTVDVPSGRLETVARWEQDRVVSVRFRNVPAFLAHEDLPVGLPAGVVDVDIGFGGAFYAMLPAAGVGEQVGPASLPRLIDLGRQIKATVEREHDIAHPGNPELRGIYGVIFFDDLGVQAGEHVQRNVAIFADGEVDRSPCGSGTSARLAALDARGLLPGGAVLRHRSIVGTEFRARVTEQVQVDGLPAVITEVEGSAWLTGTHEFVLDEHDPLGLGFLLR